MNNIFSYVHMFLYCYLVCCCVINQVLHDWSSDSWHLRTKRFTRQIHQTPHTSSSYIVMSTVLVKSTIKFTVHCLVQLESLCPISMHTFLNVNYVMDLVIMVKGLVSTLRVSGIMTWPSSSLMHQTMRRHMTYVKENTQLNTPKKG